MSFESVDERTQGLIEDDYYTLLNLDRNATPEEIRDAYKKASRIYHPDKHTDPVLKKQAEILFTKTKKAYEVLIDPHKRAIYDALGVKGLETEGWELVQRTKTPYEIREEFERLERERQERRLQQRANPRGNITIGINATDLFESYDDEYEEDDYIEEGGFSFPNLEISSMEIDQSLDAPLTTKDTLSLTGNLQNKNGIGGGAFATSLRHVSSPTSWSEYQFTAGHGPLFGIKWFRYLTKRSFCTITGLCHYKSGELTPGIEVVLYRHLDKNLEGFVTWKFGLESCVNTTVVWKNSKHAVISRIQFGIPNTFISMSYTRNLPFNDTKIKCGIKGGFFGAIVEYGWETRISQHSIAGTTMSIGTTSGVSCKLRLKRANQTYTFSILLSEIIIPSPIFYGTLVPIAAYFCAKSIVIDPYNEAEKEKELRKAKQENAVELIVRKREAEAAIALMSETYYRNVNSEKAKSGLIIEKAIYGSIKTISIILENPSEESSPSQLDGIHDVTIPTQCLVQNSNLILHCASKSNLPGFYDPCFGEDKGLLIRYKFKNDDHLIVINDDEKLKIPSQNHNVRSNF